MGFVADQDDPAVSFRGLGGQQVRCLAHQLGFEVAWLGAQRPDDRDIQAPGPERRVGDVNHLVPGRVQAGDGGAQRHRLARPDVPRDDSQR